MSDGWVEEVNSSRVLFWKALQEVVLVEEVKGRGGVVVVVFVCFYPFQSSAGHVADVVQGTDLRLHFELQLLVLDLHVSAAWTKPTKKPHIIIKQKPVEEELRSAEFIQILAAFM